MSDSENEIRPEEFPGQPLTEADRKNQAALLVFKWIQDNRPELTPSVKQATALIIKHGDRYYVGLMVKNPQTLFYDRLSFWADPVNHVVEFIESQR